MLFDKKHEKQTIMKQEEFNQKTEQENVQKISVHNLSDTNCFPFNAIEVNEKFTPILGNSKVSNEVFETLEDCKEYIVSKPYELIIALVGETFKMLQEYENEQKVLAESK